MSLVLGAVVAFLIMFALPAHADKVETKLNLASFGAGAIVVAQPVAYSDGWSGFWLLDEDPTTGYAAPEGDLAPKAFVIELADRDSISEVSFDSAQAENRARSAKGVSVEISDKSDGGWQPLITATLAESSDNQHFPVKTPKTGRYLRLTLVTNHGDAKYNELMGFGAYGKVVEKLRSAMSPVPMTRRTARSGSRRAASRRSGATSTTRGSSRTRGSMVGCCASRGPRRLIRPAAVPRSWCSRRTVRPSSACGGPLPTRTRPADGMAC
jgi:hypothetical protein